MIKYMDFIEQVFEYDTPRIGKKKLISKIIELEKNVKNSQEYIWRYLFCCVNIHENVIEQNIEIVNNYGLWDIIATSQNLSITFIGKHKFEFTKIEDILKYQNLSIEEIEYLAQFFSNDKERYDPFWCTVAKYYVLDPVSLQKYYYRISPSILILCQKLTEEESLDRISKIKNCPNDVVWRVLCRYQTLSKETLVENAELVDASALLMNTNVDIDPDTIEQIAFLKKVMSQGG